MAGPSRGVPSISAKRVNGRRAPAAVVAAMPGVGATEAAGATPVRDPASGSGEAAATTGDGPRGRRSGHRLDALAVREDDAPAFTLDQSLALELGQGQGDGLTRR